MARFGSRRDARFVAGINRELIKHVIDTPVLYYTINPYRSKTNMYGESTEKVYNQPHQIHAVITVDDNVFGIEVGDIDNTQPGTFAFWKEDMESGGLYPTPGDIIEYRSRFFEVDNVFENQLFAGKDPDNWLQGNSHGSSISIVCNAHMTRQSQLSLVNNSFGGTKLTDDSTLPSNV